MKIINSENAPKAVGPYSQAVVANGFVFLSGQIGLDPRTGELVNGGVKAETEQVLKNLKEVLIEANANLDTVISVNVYLKSMRDFKDMNDIYASAFPTTKPARVTVGVTELPKNALVEISCVACLVRV